MQCQTAMRISDDDKMCLYQLKHTFITESFGMKRYVSLSNHNMIEVV